MFKKILDAILDLKNDTNSNLRSISGAMSNTIKMDNTIEELTEMLKCQLKLLDQVINNSFEKNNTELDTVVLIPYRGKPYVYKDGKRISTDRANSFSVNWAFDSKTEVNVYNE